MPKFIEEENIGAVEETIDATSAREFGVIIDPNDLCNLDSEADYNYGD